MIRCWLLCLAWAAARAASTVNVDAQLRAATTFDRALSNDTAAPSFRVAGGRCGAQKAAYVFAGHARTLSGTRASIVSHALEPFGADAYVFVYLTRDDPGSSRGFSRARADAAAAVAALRPKRAVYGDVSIGAPVLDPACVLPGDDVVRTPSRAAGGGARVYALWQTWAKVARCFFLAVGYERDHALTFDVFVRLRADARFVLPIAFAPCDLAPATAAVPLGVAGCGAPCVNDHLMWVPRPAADAAFLSVVRDFDACAAGAGAESNPFRTLGDFGTYLRSTWVAAGLDVAAVLAPYTIERPCGAGACAECDRWTRAKHHRKVWQRWLPQRRGDFDAVYSACVADGRPVCGATPETSGC